MTPNPQLFGRGHSSGSKTTETTSSQRFANTMILKRRWRLGDVIMCEPVCRELSHRGNPIIFCTGVEYHAVVQSFPLPTPRVMSYPPPRSNMMVFEDEIDLDVVTLDHPGYLMKIDAFLSAAGINPEDLSREQRTPSIILQQRHEAWARTRLSTMGISNEPIIGIVRSPYDGMSPRSIPDSVIDSIGRRLSIDHHVIYIGSTPTRIELGERIHNMTGITPDVMSAAALMTRLRVMITVDTGLMHLGGALGIPMVTIMGPTRPEDLATIYPNNTIIDMGRECSPCYDRGCDDRCLNMVSDDMVIELTRSRIDHPNAPTTIHPHGR